uniref:Uncharacterized protein n=1 Tax=Cucumis melo TaxID=3656 RepID=A0A9I9D5Q2_CUCME
RNEQKRKVANELEKNSKRQFKENSWQLTNLRRVDSGNRQIGGEQTTMVDAKSRNTLEEIEKRSDGSLRRMDNGLTRSIEMDKRRPEEER